MRKNKKISTYFIIFFLLLIGVIYAILQANLQINGIAKIKSNTWDIHFNNIQVNENSVSIGTGDSAATIDSNDNCKVDFEVTLSVPGDFYEFTVDVVNAGTIDGMIGTITKTLKVNNELVSETPDYLDYNVTYDGGDPILEKHLLEEGQTLTYKVRLEYRSDIEELPNAATISSSFGVEFVQADDTAIKKPPIYPCTYDGELVQGAEYTNGQYTYHYMQESSGSSWTNITDDGWGVRLTDYTSTNPVTTRMCSSINNKPIVSMRNTFYGSKATSIDTSSINTSNVKNMGATFAETTGITEIDVSGFDTSNVTNITGMFRGCTGLTALDISNFDSSNITSLGGFIRNCTNLEYVNFSNYDFTRASSLGTGFFTSDIADSCSKLKIVDFTNAKFPSNMNSAFSGKNIEEIIFDNVDTSLVTDMGQMFSQCTKLKKIDLSDFNTSNVNNMRYMFQNCRSLTSLDLSNFDTKNVTRMESMFSGCSGLISLNLSGFDITKMTQDYQIRGFVSSCSSLKELNLSNWDFSSLSNYSGTLIGTIIGVTTIEDLNLSGVTFPSSLNGAFQNMTNLKNINLDGCDTSRTTNMNSMFYSCSALTSIDLSSFNTSNVTDFNYMFNRCSSLTSIDLSSFNMSSGSSNVSNMFYDDNSITTAYARTQADADILNGSSNKPTTFTFVVKP